MTNVAVSLWTHISTVSAQLVLQQRDLFEMPSGGEAASPDSTARKSCPDLALRSKWRERGRVPEHPLLPGRPSHPRHPAGWAPPAEMAFGCCWGCQGGQQQGAC